MYSIQEAIFLGVCKSEITRQKHNKSLQAREVKSQQNAPLPPSRLPETKSRPQWPPLRAVQVCGTHEKYRFATTKSFAPNNT